MKLIHQWEGGLHKHDTQTHKQTHKVILGLLNSGIDMKIDGIKSIDLINPTHYFTF